MINTIPTQLIDFMLTSPLRPWTSMIITMANKDGTSARFRHVQCLSRSLLAPLRYQGLLPALHKKRDEKWAVRLSPGGPIFYLAAVARHRAGHVFPVRGVPIVLINAGSPGRISHVRPVVLIETRSILQQFLVNVQDCALFLPIDVVL